MYALITNQPEQNLALRGGATNYLFEETENKLYDVKYQKAIGEFVNKYPEIANQYHSVLDFIFCELFPKWQKKCLKE